MIMMFVANVYGATDSADDVIHKYINEQFSGKTDWLVTKYSKFDNVTDVNLMENIDDGVEYDFRYQPFFISKSYIVKSINIVNKYSADAIVTYYNIGKGIVTITETNHKFTDIVKLDNNYETVMFKLEKRGGKWFVINPPAPHVSLEAVKSSYEEYFASRKLIDNPELNIKVNTAHYFVYRAYKHLLELIRDVQSQ